MNRTGRILRIILTVGVLMILSSCVPVDPTLPTVPASLTPPSTLPVVPTRAAATPAAPQPTMTPTLLPSPAIVPDKTVLIRVGEVNPQDPWVKPLLGVISGPDPGHDTSVANLTSQYQDIGVTSVRNNDYYDDRLDMEGIFNCGGATYPSWEGCDPNDDQFYNWDLSDAQFQSYLNGGFEPFLRLGGEFANGPRDHDFKGPQNAIQETNWIVAAVKVVDRYINWPSQPNSFTYLDIWTEFPGPHFWSRRQSEFIPFWIQAYTTLKDTYPSLKVGGPGFGSSESEALIAGNEENAVIPFLASLFKQGVKPDWLGWHLMSNDPAMFWQAAAAYQDLLNGQGQYAHVPWAGTGHFSDTELIVDAYGLNIRQLEMPDDEKYRLAQKKEGASRLTSAWIALQYSHVERAYYYRGNDMRSDSRPGAGNPDQDLGGQGLFMADVQGTYKPSAHAFRLWSIVVNQFPMLASVNLPPVDPEMPLWVLAAQNDRGQRALLMANPTTENIGWTVSFASGPAELEDYRHVEIYQVDDFQDGRTATVWNDGPVTIPAGCVQLILLLP